MEPSSDSKHSSTGLSAAEARVLAGHEAGAELLVLSAAELVHRGLAWLETRSLGRRFGIFPERHMTMLVLRDPPTTAGHTVLDRAIEIVQRYQERSRGKPASVSGIGHRVAGQHPLLRRNLESRFSRTVKDDLLARRLMTRNRRLGLLTCFVPTSAGEETRDRLRLENRRLSEALNQARRSGDPAAVEALRNADHVSIFLLLQKSSNTVRKFQLLPDDVIECFELIRGGWEAATDPRDSPF